MTKFRYGASVNTISHGSGINEYDIVRKEGKKWICIRPERQYTPLEHDVRKRGFERVPEVLFGRKRATCKMDSNGLLWYSDFVNQDELYFTSLHNPEWLLKNISERIDVITTCKEFISEVNSRLEEDNLTKSACIEYLERWEEISASLYPYMFLTLMTDEMIIEDFQQLLFEYTDKTTANAMIGDLLRSEYTKNAAKGGYAPNKTKIFTFPPEKYYYPQGEIVLDRMSEQDDIVLNKVLQTELDSYWNSVDTYFRYRLVAPLVFQLSEENFYVGKSILISMNHVVDYVGEKLIEEGIINEKSETQEMHLDELIGQIEHTNFE